MSPETDRPSWDTYFMDITTLVAKRTTCLRRAVGAIIVKDKRILSTGYNGAPSHIRHCREVGCLREQLKVIKKELGDKGDSDEDDQTCHVFVSGYLKTVFWCILNLLTSGILATAYRCGQMCCLIFLFRCKRIEFSRSHLESD